MQARKLRHLQGLCDAAPPARSSVATQPLAWYAAAKAGSHRLKKPPEFTWRDYAIMLLHIAAAIEHALMVQYLYAAYSLGGEQVPATHRPMVERWRNNILAIAKEEMGHLLTVQNVLALLGGPISLDREDYPWDSPFYPAPFTLAPLSLGTLALYVFAEMPEAWEGADKAEIVERALLQACAFSPQPQPQVNRVGIVYQTLIAILADHRRLPDAAFQAASLPMQASWDEWGRGYKSGARDAEVIIERVATRDEALLALHKIVRQGESPDAAKRAVAGSLAQQNPPPAAVRLWHRLQREERQGGSTGLSHFERFLGIYREYWEVSRMAGQEDWNPALAVAVNPTVEPQTRCTLISREPAAHWASLFNLRYRMLLAYLSHALLLARQQEDGEMPSLRGVVMHRVFAEMYNLKTLAGILVRLPATEDGGVRAGPPFQMPYTLTLPALPYHRWLLHRDLIREADSLRRALLRLGKRHKLSRQEAGYLMSLADIDRQTRSWIEQLLAGGVLRRSAAL
jgi:hypothetical protein